MRNFTQYFGSFLYDPANNNVHPIHKDWTPEMVDRFKITKTGDDRIWLPIIPDLNLLLDNYNAGDRRFHYDCRFKPKYDPAELFAIKGKMETRFRRILDRAMEDISNIEKDDEKQFPISDKLMKKAFRRSWLARVGSTISGWGVGLIKRPAKKAIAKSLTKTVIRLILNDLEQAKILKTNK